MTTSREVPISLKIPLNNMENIIEVRNLKYKYDSESENYTLNDVSFQVKKGEWLSIVGHNGSGKSTTVRLIDGLLEAESGDIIISGDKLTAENVWEKRRQIGMVFQNPDNQFVGATVEDDVAFGLENQGLDYDLMVERVQQALEFVSMQDFKEREPARLSGGQKQRVAVAGVLALRPDIIILDEATSMLDPEGRLDLIQTVKKIKDGNQLTVISITHDLDEIALSDRVLVMKEGQVESTATPRELFSREDLEELGLDQPFVNQVKAALRQSGLPLPDSYLTEKRIAGSTMGITLKNVSYTYQAGTPFEGPALFGVDLEIKSGSYTALIGHTGSGKSTILQLLNGLLVPNQGSVEVGSTVITADSVNKDIKQVRKKVGLVFQFPESQVFDETVLKDVAFGPQNFGVSKEEAEALARKKLHLVGISEDLFNRSPFELSGGQMRRVAIAGILAMEPDILVLDEPTAGLDPFGRKELMSSLKSCIVPV